MSQEYTIQEVSELMGLSIYTLRYYEKIGLIWPVQRNASGYRKYIDRDIAWLKFVNRLRTTGMPVNEMVKYAFLLRQGDGTIPERRELLEKHREKVLQRIEDLTNNLDAIAQKIAFYQGKEVEIAEAERKYKPVSTASGG